jgi:hypothetical protein
MRGINSGNLDPNSLRPVLVSELVNQVYFPFYIGMRAVLRPNPLMPAKKSTSNRNAFTRGALVAKDHRATGTVRRDEIGRLTEPVPHAELQDAKAKSSLWTCSCRRKSQSTLFPGACHPPN